MKINETSFPPSFVYDVCWNSQGVVHNWSEIHYQVVPACPLKLIFFIFTFFFFFSSLGSWGEGKGKLMRERKIHCGWQGRDLLLFHDSSHFPLCSSKTVFKVLLFWTNQDLVAGAELTHHVRCQMLSNSLISVEHERAQPSARAFQFLNIFRLSNGLLILALAEHPRTSAVCDMSHKVQLLGILFFNVWSASGLKFCLHLV